MKNEPVYLNVSHSGESQSRYHQFWISSHRTTIALLTNAFDQPRLFWQGTICFFLFYLFSGSFAFLKFLSNNKQNRYSETTVWAETACQWSNISLIVAFVAYDSPSYNNKKKYSLSTIRYKIFQTMINNPQYAGCRSYSFGKLLTV